jgi:hypothetical protein
MTDGNKFILVGLLWYSGNLQKRHNPENAVEGNFIFRVTPER